MSQSTTCQLNNCTDIADVPVYLEEGGQVDFCEDHANMCPDGTPVDGYEPNDPEKFTAMQKRVSDAPERP